MGHGGIDNTVCVAFGGGSSARINRARGCNASSPYARYWRYPTIDKLRSQQPHVLEVPSR
jgi:hypothetical protein